MMSLQEILVPNVVLKSQSKRQQVHSTLNIRCDGPMQFSPESKHSPGVSLCQRIWENRLVVSTCLNLSKHICQSKHVKTLLHHVTSTYVMILIRRDGDCKKVYKWKHHKPPTTKNQKNIWRNLLWLLGLCACPFGWAAWTGCTGGAETMSPLALWFGHPKI